MQTFLLSGNSITAQAYYKARVEGEIVHSADTFNEFSDVFIRPKFDRYLPLEKRLNIIEDLKALVRITPVTYVINACRDPKDNKYLELAASADATCIVTGDRDLLVLNPFEGIKILPAADFLKMF